MLKSILVFLALVSTSTDAGIPKKYKKAGLKSINGCVQINVTDLIDCPVMCNYCSSQLRTFNYFFTDSVCSSQREGCSGNPIVGNVYTCCSY